MPSDTTAMLDKYYERARVGSYGFFAKQRDTST